MKIISKSVLCASLFLTACGGASSGDNSSASRAGVKSVTPSAIETAASSAQVQIKHDGKVLASYPSALPDAALDKENQTLGLSLSGSDSKQMLMIAIEGTKTGVYQVSGDGKSKVSVMFMTDVLPTPSLAFDKGELNITELSDKYCSGTFTATGTAGSKTGYSVEATFSKLPVVPTARNSR